MKKSGNATELKEQLKQDIADGKLSIGDATRRMRKIVGMNQKDYARNVLGISPRILMEIETGNGNPTVDTLRKIGRPFGFDIGFVAARKN